MALMGKTRAEKRMIVFLYITVDDVVSLDVPGLVHRLRQLFCINGKLAHYNISLLFNG
jgi:hypothetical protein